MKQTTTGLLICAAITTLCSCSSDDKVPMATGNELTGVLSKQQVALTVNGHDYPSEVKIASPDDTDGTAVSDIHTLNMTIGALQLPEISISYTGSYNDRKVVYSPKFTQAEIPVNAVLGRSGMTVEGVMDFGKTHISMTGIVDNPTASADRKLKADIVYDMSAFKAAGHTYEMRLDDTNITRTANYISAEKPVFEADGETLTPQQALDWLTDQTLASLRSTLGCDKVRFTFGTDGRMEVALRYLSTGQYETLYQHFAYLPDKSNQYIYMYAPEEFNQTITESRKLAEDVWGLNTFWMAVSSPSSRTEAHVYSIHSVSESQLSLGYLDSDKSMDLWLLKTDGAYPNNPDVQETEHSKAWKVIAWLKRLMSERKIEVRSFINAKKVS